ncbi:MAG: TonB-dependent receptor [Gammaproteobacteria bacterium]|nr:TonB-dependent receptor [Gammaproteobacteria bacterium]
MGKLLIVFIFFTFTFFIFSSASATFTTTEIPTVLIAADQNTVNSTNLNNFATTDFSQSPVQTITAKELSQSSAGSLLDALALSNAVTIIEPDGIASRSVFALRGFSDNAASNTAVLLNGQPLSDPDLGIFSLNAIPLSSIKRIEIIPGSAAVLLGDQAVGGIINVITTEPEKHLRHAQISYGNFATKQAQVSFGDKIFANNFGYIINARHYDSDNYRENNAENENNFDLALTYDNLDFAGKIRYFKIDQRLRLPGALTWQQVLENPRQAENTIAYNNQDTDLLQLGAKYNLNSNWQIVFTGNLQTMQGVGAYLFQGITTSFTEARHALEFRPTISGTINTGNNSIFPILGIDLSTGDYRLNTVTSSQKMLAEFLQVNIPIHTNITLVVGARNAAAFYDLYAYDFYTYSKIHATPINRAFIDSEELSWQVRENLRMFLRRAGSFRFPKTDEETYALNSKPLNTQLGVSYEGGVVFANNFLQTSAAIYQLNLTNEIAAIPIATAEYQIYNTNLDPTRRQGFSLSALFQVLPQWQINTGYDFVCAKFNSGSYAGKDMPFVARNNFSVRTVYTIHTALNLFIEGRYTGARFPINDVTNSAGLLGGFTIFNVGAEYENTHVKIDARINNLTNKLYYGYVVVNSGNLSALKFYPGSGLSALFTLAVKL